MKLSDKELLELAAKAAGVNGKYTEDVCCGVGISQPSTTYKTSEYNKTVIQLALSWNPLTDDGDALRLAVKLNAQIDIDFDMPHKNNVCVGAFYGDEEGAFAVESGEDHYAATRRAIVRTAAEVGKGMLSQAEFILMFPDRFDEETVKAAEIGKGLQ